jgi:hypothetical protein
LKTPEGVCLIRNKRLGQSEDLMQPDGDLTGPVGAASHFGCHPDGISGLPAEFSTGRTKAFATITDTSLGISKAMFWVDIAGIAPTNA